jgi:DNA polymerase III sliding clamp (beta) subunit (PCNA family)
MKKSSLEGFISRYTLGGEIESVKIISDKTGMTVKFISDDKTLLGTVTSEDAEFADGEFGVYTTSQLKNLLGVLDANINVTAGSAALEFSDNSTTVNYMMADLSVIPAVPDIKQIPEFESEITLSDEFIGRFIKSKGALSDSDTFTFQCKGGKGEIILGYSKINSNRISIKVDCTCTKDSVGPISFSAKYLKEILNANRTPKAATLKIATAGLAHCTFESEGFKSEYFLVEVK